MTNVVDFDPKDRPPDLRTYARAIAFGGGCSYDYALDLLTKAYAMGSADGERKAWMAQKRADDAAAEQRRKAREQSNG